MNARRVGRDILVSATALILWTGANVIKILVERPIDLQV